MRFLQLFMKLIALYKLEHKKVIMYYTRGLNVSIIFVMVANNISTVEILDEGDSEFLICCKDPFEKVEL